MDDHLVRTPCQPGEAQHHSRTQSQSPLCNMIIKIFGEYILLIMTINMIIKIKVRIMKDNNDDGNDHNNKNNTDDHSKNEIDDYDDNNDDDNHNDNDNCINNDNNNDDDNIISYVYY